MDVVFADPDLARIETDEAAQMRLPVGVIKSARRKLALLRAAPDERSLRNWKSLHFEKLKGDRDGERSIRLNDQYRMILTLDGDAASLTATIKSIEDYH